MKRDWEVIVIGAGPAGATLGYELAKKGISVLLLEKESLPRYKCCAGGITLKTAKLIGTEFQEVIEDSISRTLVTFKGNNPYHGHYDQTLMYTVMRDRFDHALVQRAEQAGAVVIQGQKVHAVQPHPEYVEVSSSTGNFRSQFLAGADGNLSLVARTLKLRDNASYVAGIETEVTVPNEELARWRAQTGIDIGQISGGYAWVFPKSSHLSIGLACHAIKARNLKRSYWEFLHSLNFSHYNISRWSGGLIPLCRGEATVTRDRIILLGDAAGLADPLTGEGIHNAILSAQLAAPVIEQALLNNEAALPGYQKAIEEKVLPEMKIAYLLSKIMVQFPSMLFKMLKRDERVWRGYCYLLRGEISYLTIRQKLNKLDGIYAILSRMI